MDIVRRDKEGRKNDFEQKQECSELQNPIHLRTLPKLSRILFANSTDFRDRVGDCCSRTQL